MYFLGLEMIFISRVRCYEKERKLRPCVLSFNLKADDIQEDPTHPTGKVNITLDKQGYAHFVIHKRVAYDFLEVIPKALHHVAKVDLIYIGTLMQRTLRRV